MKILITGGYGFIGSHVVERLVKEGHDIFIIDNLSTGRVENVTAKHKGYIIDIESPKCEEVFNAHRIDVVIHLAAQVSVKHSLIHPQTDALVNIVGTVNLLDLAAKYKVKQFIYSSSAAVYQSVEGRALTEEDVIDPISPYGISKQMSELYANKWSKLFQLKTLGLRFSNVFGPRQCVSTESDGAVVALYLNAMYNNKPLTVYGDGKQTRDFIYVEDVADAIYRAINTTLEGIYNLSTNTSNSINSLVEICRSYRPDLEINYASSRPNDIKHSRLDNSKIMDLLDWSPMYTLEDGIKKIYLVREQEEARLQAATTIENTAKKKKKLILGKGAIQTFENILAFLITVWLSLNVFNNQAFQLDIRLFYIVFIGTMFGSRQSIIAVMLSIALLTYEKVNFGRDILSLTYDTGYLFQLAVYIFIGLVIGYTFEKKNEVIANQQADKQQLQERYEFLEEVHQEVREIKDELQLRIINSEDSYGTMYNATKELESLEPEKVFVAAVNVMKSIMKVEKVAIYRVNQYQSYLRLLACSGYKKNELANSLKVDDFPYLQSIIESGEYYFNKQLDPNIPNMVAPILYKNKITAIIAIDSMKFEQVSLYSQNLFQITVNLISSALYKAFNYIDATESNRYISNTSILKKEFFASIVSSRLESYDRNAMNFMLVKCSFDTLMLEEVSSLLAPSLRETDYLGLNDKDELILLLSNISPNDIEAVLRRLSHPQLTYKLINMRE